MSTKPKYGLLALAFVLIFVTQISLANRMSYNIVSFLNTSFVVALASGISVLCFRILLPPDPARDARGLIHGIRGAVQNLSRGAYPNFGRDPLSWQVRANQRLQRLFLRLQVDPVVRARAIGDCGAVLIIALEILRLRDIIPTLRVPPREAADAKAALVRLRDLSELDKAQAAAERACASLTALETAAATEDGLPAHHPDYVRVAARFRTIAALMPQAKEFFALETSFGVRA